MTNFVRETKVNRPTPDATKSSVLDHAKIVNVPEGTGFGTRTEVGMWPSYNCLPTFTDTPICPDPAGEKEFDSVDWTGAFSFGVYAGVECRALGLDKADQDAEVKRVFERNEGKGIEAALKSTRFVARTGSGLTDDGRGIATWAAPTDLTAGIDASPQVAFAMLEGYARATYAGVPTLHLPVGAASFLGQDKVVWQGEKAYSHLGSKIVFGGGYEPDYGEGDWDGSWQMWATGDVYIERSKQINLSAYDLPGGRGGAADEGRNHYMTLAERMYRVAVDCFVATATGKVGSAPGVGFGN